MKSGTTLVELLVVLAVLGVALATVPLLLPSRSVPAATDWRSQLADARRRAIKTGSPVSGFTDSIGRFTAFPEGFLISDSARVPHAR